MNLIGNDGSVVIIPYNFNLGAVLGELLMGSYLLYEIALKPLKVPTTLVYPLC